MNSNERGHVLATGHQHRPALRRQLRHRIDWRQCLYPQQWCDRGRTRRDRCFRRDRLGHQFRPDHGGSGSWQWHRQDQPFRHHPQQRVGLWDRVLHPGHGRSVGRRSPYRDKQRHRAHRGRRPWLAGGRDWQSRTGGCGPHQQRRQHHHRWPCGADLRSQGHDLQRGHYSGDQQVCDSGRQHAEHPRGKHRQPQQPAAGKRRSGGCRRSGRRPWWRHHHRVAHFRQHLWRCPDGRFQRHPAQSRPAGWRCAA